MAARDPEIGFGPFALDPRRNELVARGRRIDLQPRPLAVLRYLAGRPGRVVSGDEILRDVWGGTAVTRGVLKVAVRAIREALGDDAASPRYIETVGRHGYRFLWGSGALEPDSAREEPAAPLLLVGRDAELGRLHEALRAGRAGTRRIVLIAGEAGIGKTTLLDRFLAEVEPRADTCVARGQCLERHGEGEPYLPVLEALGRLCRDGDAEWLVHALRQHAPSWVEQLAAIAGSEGRGGPGPSTPERMLRELADALGVATAERSLVLALEDLHWSDRATLDLVDCLARRREPAGLVVIGTHRPSEGSVAAHPLRALKQELLAKGLCEELALELLGPADVAAYLRLRLGDSPDVGAVSAAVHARTAGNALFMASVVDDLVARGLVSCATDGWRLVGTVTELAGIIPPGVQQLIAQQAERLPPEDRRLLEAASAAGVDFSVASVAAALDRDPDELEARCEALAMQGRFVEPAGVAEWPDGTLSGRYRFRHPLTCSVFYGATPERRRVRFHRAIATREEIGHGPAAGERAAELATHFERGLERERAAAHREVAAQTALRRNAPREAAAHFEHALGLVAQLPGCRARDQRELTLRVALAAPVMAMRGFAAGEVRENYARARSLCELLGAEREILPVLRGLASHHQVRGELDVARALGDELLSRAALLPDRVAQVQAHYGLGVTRFHAGEPREARGHLERAIALYRCEQQADHLRLYGGYEPSVACRLWLGWTLQVLGLAEQARGHAAEALRLAEALGHPLTLAFARYGVAVAHQTVGEWAEAEAFAELAAGTAEEYGFAYELALASILRGWTSALRGRVAEGVAELRRGLERYQATGAGLATAYRMLLAAAEAIAGRLDEAWELAEHALAESNGRGPWLEAVEVRCGAARILLARAAAQGEPASAALEREAEALLESALALARRQRAPLLELLAATSLARLWSVRGRSAQARELLAPVVAHFSEGLDTRDVRRAAKLLAGLGS